MKGSMPEKIRVRPDKMGFGTPQDEWFRTAQWRNFITDILTNGSLKQRNIIDTECATDLYKKHLTGTVNISKDIWKWVHLELWYREFID